MNNSKDRPAHVVRMGSIRAAIWRNQSPTGVRYSSTFSRRYKDRQDDQWRSTDSFGRDDLLLLAKVADAAHTWICEQRQEREPEPPALPET